MIMNMLTGAHASLIPLITALHDECASGEHYDVSKIITKLDAILGYESESWVKDMTVDMIIDFFEKLPEEIVIEVSQNIELHDDIPLRLCLYMMDKNINIAQDMIENTDILDETDLIYRIYSGEVREMIAVARRKKLPPDVLNALIESENPEVYMELLNNPCVQVQADVIRHLSEVTQRSPKMAWYMVTQPLTEIAFQDRIISSSQAAR